LSLAGLSPQEAAQAAESRLRDGLGEDLSSMLVLDDTAALAGHGDTFGRLLGSGQVAALVCICVGPPADPWHLPIPGAISLDSAVLWVGDQTGVDCGLSGPMVGRARPADGPDGASQLADLLSCVEVFERVHELYQDVPNRVASPGLRLAQAQADTAAFASGLVLAVGRITTAQPVPGPAEPFAELLPARTDDQWLADDGELKRAEFRARQAATEAAGVLADVMRMRQPVAVAVQRLEAAAGALTDLRLLAARLLEDGHTTDQLTRQQRDRLREAGVLLTDPDDTSGGDLATVSAVLPEVLRQPGGLPAAEARLAATEQRLGTEGSRTYLRQLDDCYPADLSRRLLTPPGFPPLQPWLPLVGALGAAVAGLGGAIGGAAVAVAWIGLLGLTMTQLPRTGRTADWRLAVNAAAAGAGAAAGWALSTAVHLPVAATATVGALILVVGALWSWRSRVRAWRVGTAADEAAAAAGALTDLVAQAARRSWSKDSSRIEAVARVRIALEGVGDELADYASAQSPKPGDQAGRLADALVPVLADLVLEVLDGLPASAAADGQADYLTARHQTRELVAEWEQHADRHGPLLPPRFARDDHALGYSSGSGEKAIRTAAGYDPREEMWQLCRPADLQLLDLSSKPLTVPFAPRTAESALSRVLPPGTAWTSGHRAGLLRLVPLRDYAHVTVTWDSGGRPERQETGEGS
jgi:hypothetical protein